MEFFEFLYYADFFLFSVDNPAQALMIGMIVAGVLFLVVYAMEAVALYTIAKREGYKHKWMAFVPFFNSYYIGVVSDKNRFYNLPSKSVSLALAIVELLLVAGYILYYSVAGIVYAGELYDVVTQQVTAMGQTQTVIVGYAASSTLWQRLPWMAWIFDYLESYVLTWVNLLYILLSVLVIISFFQTYACRRYIWLSLGSVLFPIKGILMFAVRNNKGLNYRDYVRGEQRRRYEMYQQYSNQNGGNPYGGYNPYNGRPGTPPSGSPYQPPRPDESAADPFDGLGASSDNKSSGSDSSSSSTSPDDPFEEFKK